MASDKAMSIDAGPSLRLPGEIDGARAQPALGTPPSTTTSDVGQIRTPRHDSEEAHHSASSGPDGNGHVSHDLAIIPSPVGVGDNSLLRRPLTAPPLPPVISPDPLDEPMSGWIAESTMISFQQEKALSGQRARSRGNVTFEYRCLLETGDVQPWVVMRASAPILLSSLPFTTTAHPPNATTSKTPTKAVAATLSPLASIVGSPGEAPLSPIANDTNGTMAVVIEARTRCHNGLSVADTVSESVIAKYRISATPQAPRMYPNGGALFEGDSVTAMTGSEDDVVTMMAGSFTIVTTPISSPKPANSAADSRSEDVSTVCGSSVEASFSALLVIAAEADSAVSMHARGRPVPITITPVATRNGVTTKGATVTYWLSPTVVKTPEFFPHSAARRSSVGPNAELFEPSTLIALRCATRGAVIMVAAGTGSEDQDPSPGDPRFHPVESGVLLSECPTIVSSEGRGVLVVRLLAYAELPREQLTTAADPSSGFEDPRSPTSMGSVGDLLLGSHLTSNNRSFGMSHYSNRTKGGGGNEGLRRISRSNVTVGAYQLQHTQVTDELEGTVPAMPMINGGIKPGRRLKMKGGGGGDSQATTAESVGGSQYRRIGSIAGSEAGRSQAEGDGNGDGDSRGDAIPKSGSSAGSETGGGADGGNAVAGGADADSTAGAAGAAGDGADMDNDDIWEDTYYWRDDIQPKPSMTPLLMSCATSGVSMRYIVTPINGEAEMTTFGDTGLDAGTSSKKRAPEGSIVTSKNTIDCTPVWKEWNQHAPPHLGKLVTDCWWRDGGPGQPAYAMFLVRAVAYRGGFFSKEQKMTMQVVMPPAQMPTLHVTPVTRGEVSVTAVGEHGHTTLFSTNGAVPKERKDVFNGRPRLFRASAPTHQAKDLETAAKDTVVVMARCVKRGYCASAIARAFICVPSPPQSVVVIDDALQHNYIEVYAKTHGDESTGPRVGLRSARVSWKSTKGQTLPVSHYIIRTWRLNDPNSDNWTEQIVSSSQNFAVVTQLHDDVQYVFSVAAQNTYGRGPPGDGVTFTCSPIQDIGDTASAPPNSLALPSHELSFLPTFVRIHPGDTVIWQWQSFALATPAMVTLVDPIQGDYLATADAPDLVFFIRPKDSGRFEQTFTRPGSYLLCCVDGQENANMCYSTIVVEPPVVNIKQQPMASGQGHTMKAHSSFFKIPSPRSLKAANASSGKHRTLGHIPIDVAPIVCVSQCDVGGLMSASDDVHFEVSLEEKPHRALLKGETRRRIGENGCIQFSGLSVTVPGRYCLRFYSPEIGCVAISESFVAGSDSDFVAVTQALPHFHPSKPRSNWMRHLHWPRVMTVLAMWLVSIWYPVLTPSGTTVPFDPIPFELSNAWSASSTCMGESFWVTVSAVIVALCVAWACYLYNRHRASRETCRPQDDTVGAATFHSGTWSSTIGTGREVAVGSSLTITATSNPNDDDDVDDLLIVPQVGDNTGASTTDAIGAVHRSAIFPFTTEYRRRAPKPEHMAMRVVRLHDAGDEASLAPPKCTHPGVFMWKPNLSGLFHMEVSCEKAESAPAGSELHVPMLPGPSAGSCIAPVPYVPDILSALDAFDSLSGDTDVVICRATTAAGLPCGSSIVEGLAVGGGCAWVLLHAVNDVEIKHVYARAPVDDTGVWCATIDSNHPAIGTQLVARHLPLGLDTSDTLGMCAQSLPFPCVAANAITVLSLSPVNVGVGTIRGTAPESAGRVVCMLVNDEVLIDHIDVDENGNWCVSLADDECDLALGCVITVLDRIEALNVEAASLPWITKKPSTLLGVNRTGAESPMSFSRSRASSIARYDSLHSMHSMPTSPSGLMPDQKQRQSQAVNAELRHRRTLAMAHRQAAHARVVVSRPMAVVVHTITKVEPWPQRLAAVIWQLQFLSMSAAMAVPLAQGLSCSAPLSILTLRVFEMPALTPIGAAGVHALLFAVVIVLPVLVLHIIGSYIDSEWDPADEGGCTHTSSNATRGQDNQTIQRAEGGIECSAIAPAPKQRLISRISDFLTKHNVLGWGERDESRGEAIVRTAMNETKRSLADILRPGDNGVPSRQRMLASKLLQTLGPKDGKGGPDGSQGAVSLAAGEVGELLTTADDLVEMHDNGDSLAKRWVAIDIGAAVPSIVASLGTHPAVAAAMREDMDVYGLTAWLQPNAFDAVADIMLEARCSKDGAKDAEVFLGGDSVAVDSVGHVHLRVDDRAGRERDDNHVPTNTRARSHTTKSFGTDIMVRHQVRKASSFACSVASLVAEQCNLQAAVKQLFVECVNIGIGNAVLSDTAFMQRMDNIGTSASDPAIARAAAQTKLRLTPDITGRVVQRMAAAIAHIPESRSIEIAHLHSAVNEIKARLSDPQCVGRLLQVVSDTGLVQATVAALPIDSASSNTVKKAMDAKEPQAAVASALDASIQAFAAKVFRDIADKAKAAATEAANAKARNSETVPVVDGSGDVNPLTSAERCPEIRRVDDSITAAALGVAWRIGVATRGGRLTTTTAVDGGSNQCSEDLLHLYHTAPTRAKAKHQVQVQEGDVEDESMARPRSISLMDPPESRTGTPRVSNVGHLGTHDKLLRPSKSKPTTSRMADAIRGCLPTTWGGGGGKHGLEAVRSAVKSQVRVALEESGLAESAFKVHFAALEAEMRAQGQVLLDAVSQDTGDLDNDSVCARVVLRLLLEEDGKRLEELNSGLLADLQVLVGPLAPTDRAFMEANWTKAVIARFDWTSALQNASGSVLLNALDSDATINAVAKHVPQSMALEISEALVSSLAFEIWGPEPGSEEWQYALATPTSGLPASPQPVRTFLGHDSAHSSLQGSPTGVRVPSPTRPKFKPWTRDSSGLTADSSMPALLELHFGCGRLQRQEDCGVLIRAAHESIARFALRALDPPMHLSEGRVRSDVELGSAFGINDTCAPRHVLDGMACAGEDNRLDLHEVTMRLQGGATAGDTHKKTRPFRFPFVGPHRLSQGLSAFQMKGDRKALFTAAIVASVDAALDSERMQLESLSKRTWKRWVHNVSHAVALNVAHDARSSRRRVATASLLWLRLVLFGICQSAAYTFVYEGIEDSAATLSALVAIGIVCLTLVVVHKMTAFKVAGGRLYARNGETLPSAGWLRGLVADIRRSVFGFPLLTIAVQCMVAGLSGSGITPFVSCAIGLGLIGTWLVVLATVAPNCHHAQHWYHLVNHALNFLSLSVWYCVLIQPAHVALSVLAMLVGLTSIAMPILGLVVDAPALFTPNIFGIETSLRRRRQAGSTFAIGVIVIGLLSIASTAHFAEAPSSVAWFAFDAPTIPVPLTVRIMAWAAVGVSAIALAASYGRSKRIAAVVPAGAESLAVAAAKEVGVTSPEPTVMLSDNGFAQQRIIVPVSSHVVWQWKGCTQRHAIVEVKDESQTFFPSSTAPTSPKLAVPPVQVQNVIEYGNDASDEAKLQDLPSNAGTQRMQMVKPGRYVFSSTGMDSLPAGAATSCEVTVCERVRVSRSIDGDGTLVYSPPALVIAPGTAVEFVWQGEGWELSIETCDDDGRPCDDTARLITKTAATADFGAGRLDAGVDRTRSIMHTFATPGSLSVRCVSEEERRRLNDRLYLYRDRTKQFAKSCLVTVATEAPMTINLTAREVTPRTVVVNPGEWVVWRSAQCPHCWSRQHTPHQVIEVTNGANSALRKVGGFSSGSSLGCGGQFAHRFEIPGTYSFASVASLERRQLMPIAGTVFVRGMESERFEICADLTSDETAVIVSWKHNPLNTSIRSFVVLFNDAIVKRVSAASRSEHVETIRVPTESTTATLAVMVQRISARRTHDSNVVVLTPVRNAPPKPQLQVREDASGLFVEWEVAHESANSASLQATQTPTRYEVLMDGLFVCTVDPPVPPDASAMRRLSLMQRASSLSLSPNIVAKPQMIRFSHKITNLTRRRTASIVVRAFGLLGVSESQLTVSRSDAPEPPAVSVFYPPGFGWPALYWDKSQAFGDAQVTGYAVNNAQGMMISLNAIDSGGHPFYDHSSLKWEFIPASTQTDRAQARCLAEEAFRQGVCGIVGKAEQSKFIKWIGDAKDLRRKGLCFQNGIICLTVQRQQLQATPVPTSQSQLLSPKSPSPKQPPPRMLSRQPSMFMSTRDLIPLAAPRKFKIPHGAIIDPTKIASTLPVRPGDIVDASVRSTTDHPAYSASSPSAPIAVQMPGPPDAPKVFVRGTHEKVVVIEIERPRWTAGAPVVGYIVARDDVILSKADFSVLTGLEAIGLGNHRPRPRDVTSKPSAVSRGESRDRLFDSFVADNAHVIDEGDEDASSCSSAIDSEVDSGSDSEIDSIFADGKGTLVAERLYRQHSQTDVLQGLPVWLMDTEDNRTGPMVHRFVLNGAGYGEHSLTVVALTAHLAFPCSPATTVNYIHVGPPGSPELSLVPDLGEPGNNLVHIAWTRPDECEGAEIVGYNIYVDGALTQVEQHVQSMLVSSRQPGLPCTVFMAARTDNLIFPEGLWSNVVSFTTPQVTLMHPPTITVIAFNKAIMSWEVPHVFGNPWKPTPSQYDVSVLHKGQVIVCADLPSSSRRALIGVGCQVDFAFVPGTSYEIELTCNAEFGHCFSAKAAIDMPLEPPAPLTKMSSLTTAGVELAWSGYDISSLCSISSSEAPSEQQPQFQSRKTRTSSFSGRNSSQAMLLQATGAEIRLDRKQWIVPMDGSGDLECMPRHSLVFGRDVADRTIGALHTLQLRWVTQFGPGIWSEPLMFTVPVVQIGRINISTELAGTLTVNIDRFDLFGVAQMEAIEVSIEGTLVERFPAPPITGKDSRANVTSMWSGTVKSEIGKTVSVSVAVVGANGAANVTSDSFSATAAGPPGVPSEIAVDTTDCDMQVSWGQARTYGNASVDAFRVRWGMIENDGWDGPGDDTGAESASSADAAAEAGFVGEALTSAPDRKFTISGLDQETDYWIRLRSETAHIVGNGTWSTATRATLKSMTGGSISVQAFTIGTSDLTVEWEAPVCRGGAFVEHFDIACVPLMSIVTSDEQHAAALAAASISAPPSESAGSTAPSRSQSRRASVSQVSGTIQNSPSVGPSGLVTPARSLAGTVSASEVSDEMPSTVPGSVAVSPMTQSINLTEDLLAATDDGGAIAVLGAADNDIDLDTAYELTEGAMGRVSMRAPGDDDDREGTVIATANAADSNIIVSGLEAGVQYRVVVKAVSGDGFCPIVRLVTEATTAASPSRPVVRADGATETSVTVSWVACRSFGPSSLRGAMDYSACLWDDESESPVTLSTKPRAGVSQIAHIVADHNGCFICEISGCRRRQRYRVGIFATALALNGSSLPGDISEYVDITTVGMDPATLSIITETVNPATMRVDIEVGWSDLVLYGPARESLPKLEVTCTRLQAIEDPNKEHDEVIDDGDGIMAFRMESVGGSSVTIRGLSQRANHILTLKAWVNGAADAITDSLPLEYNTPAPPRRCTPGISRLLPEECVFAWAPPMAFGSAHVATYNVFVDGEPYGDPISGIDESGKTIPLVSARVVGHEQGSGPHTFSVQACTDSLVGNGPISDAFEWHTPGWDSFSLTCGVPGSSYCTVSWLPPGTLGSAVCAGDGAPTKKVSFFSLVVTKQLQDEGEVVTSAFDAEAFEGLLVDRSTRATIGSVDGDTHTLVLSALPPGMCVSVIAEAIIQVGSTLVGKQSNKVSFEIAAPPAPVKFTDPNLRQASAHIEWLPSRPFGDALVEGYEIQVDGNVLGTKQLPSDRTILLHAPPLTRRRVHTCAVRALSSHAVGHGAWSILPNGFELPCLDAPVLIGARALGVDSGGTLKAEVVWLKATMHGPACIDGYTVKCKPGLEDEFETDCGPELSCQIPVPTGSLLRLCVVARGGNGASDITSNTMIVQMPRPPSAPVVTVIAAQSSSFAIQWNKPEAFGDATVTGYNIIINGVDQPVHITDHDALRVAIKSSVKTRAWNQIASMALRGEGASNLKVGSIVLEPGPEDTLDDQANGAGGTTQGVDSDVSMDTPETASTGVTARRYWDTVKLRIPEILLNSGNFVRRAYKHFAKPGQPFTVQVQATTDHTVGHGPLSDPVSFMCASVGPPGLRLVSDSRSTIKVAWNTPATTGPAKIVEYVVKLSNSGRVVKNCHFVVSAGAGSGPRHETEVELPPPHGMGHRLLDTRSVDATASGQGAVPGAASGTGVTSTLATWTDAVDEDDGALVPRTTYEVYVSAKATNVSVASHSTLYVTIPDAPDAPKLRLAHDGVGDLEAIYDHLCALATERHGLLRHIQDSDISAMDPQRLFQDSRTLSKEEGERRQCFQEILELNEQIQGLLREQKRLFKLVLSRSDNTAAITFKWNRPRERGATVSQFVLSVRPVSGGERVEHTIVAPKLEEQFTCTVHLNLSDSYEAWLTAVTSRGPEFDSKESNILLVSNVPLMPFTMHCLASVHNHTIAGGGSSKAKRVACQYAHTLEREIATTPGGKGLADIFGTTRHYSTETKGDFAAWRKARANNEGEPLRYGLDAFAAEATDRYGSTMHKGDLTAMKGMITIILFWQPQCKSSRDALVWLLHCMKQPNSKWEQEGFDRHRLQVLCCAISDDLEPCCNHGQPVTTEDFQAAIDRAVAPSLRDIPGVSHLTVRENSRGTPIAAVSSSTTPSVAAAFDRAHERLGDVGPGGFRITHYPTLVIVDPDVRVAWRGLILAREAKMFWNKMHAVLAPLKVAL